jgi:hypothetical protein
MVGAALAITFASDKARRKTAAINNRDLILFDLKIFI